MIWVLLAVVSAFLLGIYDLFKKISVRENAVLPVLFFSTLTSALIFAPFLIISRIHPTFSTEFWFIKPQDLSSHLHFLLKSVIVSTAWVLAYFAIKHLPITIISPIQSSAPMWTLMGAFFIYGEVLNAYQWMGLSVTLFFYYLFSLSGKKEGISFRENKWVLYMVLSTMVNSVSSLYDKFLVAHYDRMAMQCWFSIYMVPIMGALMLFIWIPNRHKYDKFQWRYSIMLIGATLTIADFIYFKALSYPESLIAIVSTIRRASVLISFAGGAIFLHEKNVKRKGLILLGIFAGILLIILGGRH